MTDENTFESDLNAIMEGTIPSSTPNPTPKEEGTPGANSTANEKVWKAAGRDWKSAEDLAKSHDALWRDYGRKSNELKKLEQWGSFQKALDADPNFRTHLATQIELYQKSRAAGQSQTTAATKSQLDPEMVSKIERMETLADSIELEREESALVRKYKLDDSVLKQVEDYSVAHNGIPLEQSYKMMMFDTNSSKLQAQREADAARKKEVSRTNAPAAEHVQPSGKGGPSLKSDAEWRKAAGSELSKFFTE